MHESSSGWARVQVLAQAQGIVSVQAECSLLEALGMIEDRASVARCSVHEIAVAVVDRSIRFNE